MKGRIMKKKLLMCNKWMASVLTIVMVFNLSITSIPVSAKTTQISRWALEDFTKATKLDIFTGLENFEPMGTIKVSEFITWTDDLYQKMTAKSSIVTELINEIGSLDSESAITREQAAFVIKSMLDQVEDQISVYPAVSNIFKDLAAINPLYKDAVDYLVANDVVNGYTDNNFKPTEVLSQQQAIILLNTTYEKFENAPELFTSSAYEGFKVVEAKPLVEIGSMMYTFEHIKSGAQLVFIQNDDNNKSFSIGVKTLPENDKGIPHIIEHSVLGGSKNFQAKDPFFTIINGQSLYTFMNAMTFDNFTAYPVATTNTKDYNNLVYLYMDAVFNPLVPKEENIFLREGIRKELKSTDADMTYNGIVYNEMKGYYSNDSQVLNSAVQNALFPDTPYAYEPGGLPSAIEDLTYDEFKDFYEANYHPSNALLYLYGNVDIIDRLQFLDENYLNKYDKKAFNLEIAEQEAFKSPVTLTKAYAVSEGTDLTNQYVVDVSYVVNDYGDMEETYGLYLIAEVLNAPNSPLEIALKQAGLSTNFSVSMDANLKQNTLSFILRDTSKGQEQKFKEVVTGTLKDLADKGLDHTSANSLLSVYELSQRTVQYSTNNGLQYGINTMINWVNGAAYDKFLQYGDIFDRLAEKIKANYLETLIKTYLVDNNHCATIILEPSTTLLNTLETSSSQKLSTYQDTLKANDVEAYMKQTESFMSYVSTPDSAEVMMQLPSLSIDSLETEFSETSVTEETVNGYKLLHALAETNEIVQVDYLFDASKVTEDKLQYLKLALSLLTKVDTEKFTEEELYNAILNHSLGLNISNMALSDDKDTKAYKPKNTISFFALSDHVDDMNAIATEVLQHSKFDNKEQIQQAVSEFKTQYEMMEPIAYAFMQVQSYHSESGAYTNKLNGMEYYTFLAGIEKQLKSDPESVIKEIKAAYALAFPKEGLIVTVVGSKEGKDNVKSNLTTFTSTLPTINSQSYTYKLDPVQVDEGFTSSSQVQFSVLGTNMKDLGFIYNGKFEVLASLLNGYLLNVLRMQNGAYGGGISFDAGGNALMYSYRDPMLKETYVTFASLSKILETSEINEYELASYKISAYRKTTPLLDPITAGSNAIYNKLMNRQTDKSQLIKEILSTTAQDIKDFAPMLQMIVEKGNYCTIGNESTVKENKDLFNQVKPYLGE